MGLGEERRIVVGSLEGSSIKRPDGAQMQAAGGQQTSAKIEPGQSGSQLTSGAQNPAWIREAALLAASASPVGLPAFMALLIDLGINTPAGREMSVETLAKKFQEKFSNTELLEVTRQALMAATRQLEDGGSQFMAGLKQLLPDVDLSKAGSLTVSALEKVSKYCSTCALAPVLDFVGINTLLSSSCSLCNAKTKGEAAMAVALMAYAIFDIATTATGVGAGAKAVVKGGVKLALEAGAKEAIEKAVADCMTELAERTLNPKEVTKLAKKLVKDFGISAEQLTGKKVSEIGELLSEKIAEKVAVKTRELLAREGVSSVADLSPKALEVLSKLTKDQTHKVFNHLLEIGGLKGSVCKFTKELLESHPELMLQPKLKAELAESYLKGMSKLKDQWFSKFEGKLVAEFGADGGKFLANRLKIPFMEGIDKAALPLIKKGIDDALNSMRRGGGTGLPVEARRQSAAQVELYEREYQIYLRNGTTEGDISPETGKKEVTSLVVKTTNWVEDGREEQRKRKASAITWP